MFPSFILILVPHQCYNNIAITDCRRSDRPVLSYHASHSIVSYYNNECDADYTTEGIATGHTWTVPYREHGGWLGGACTIHFISATLDRPEDKGGSLECRARSYHTMGAEYGWKVYIEFLNCCDGGSICFLSGAGGDDAYDLKYDCASCES